MMTPEYAKAAAKYQKGMKDGLGTGRGVDYTPYLTVRGSSTQGKVSRYLGIKTGRVHHLLSTHELDYMVILDWSDKVVDIREQFPLDLARTIEIANRLGIRHPVETKSRFPSVRTTDFLIDIQTQSGIQTVARTVKPSSKLQSRRVVELFEIERTYWAERDVDWGIVTEQELPFHLCTNLKDILSFFHLGDQQGEFPLEMADLTLLLAERIQSSDQTIQKTLQFFESEYNLSPGLALRLFKHLLARKGLTVNLDRSLPSVLNMASRSVIIGDLSSWRNR